MKLKKAVTAIIMAFTLFVLSGCDFLSALVDGDTETTTYSVNLVVNNGTLDENLTSYTAGEEVTLPVPYRDYYTFDGWYDNSSFNGSAVTSVSAEATGNLTFYAKWKAEKYSVTLNLNGGSSNDVVDSYTYNVATNLPATAEKTGYTFGGWYDNALTEGEPVTGIEKGQSGDKEYWAKWVANTYDINYFNIGDAEFNGVSYYTYGVEVQLESPVRGNYTFIGWYDNDGFGGDNVTTISVGEIGDKNLYAKWQENEPPAPDSYSVTLHTDGGTLESNLISYECGTGATLPEISKVNYDFGGWYDNESFTGEPVTAIGADETGNKEFWAKWTPKVYTVTLNKNGGTCSDLSQYTYGSENALPTAVLKTGYTFGGWYDNAACTGTPVTAINSADSGNKVFWAKWTANTYSVTLNTAGGELEKGLTSYTYGVGAVLPEATRINYTFLGWYDNSACAGEPVTAISSTDIGDKEYWAGWKEVLTNINITAAAGYSEGAYVTFDAVENVSNYTVSYKKADDANYTAIDQELIRVSGNTVRADIIGLSEGEYDIQISANSTPNYASVTVSSYDRSGYAFFNRSEYVDGTAASGVGAYKDDGTPKDNAQIIYVTEGNKNTVTATFGNNVYTGIVAIMGGLSKSANPVIIRIIGRVSAATWNTITYGAAVSGTDIVNQNGKYAYEYASSGKIYQADLIANGFNTLNTSEYSELNGLVSYMTYTEDKNVYDSCWNDCQISSAKNVTVEGVGTDAEIFQWGMTWKTSSSIEVRNITFTDYTEDACSFQGNTSVKDGTVSNFNSYYLWVHNCTFNRGVNYWDVTDEQDKPDGDGATDFKVCSYITVSYNRYNNTHKTGLVGAGDTGSYTYNMTYHHNYYNACESRMPMARQANMHLYNNYYSGSTGTNMSLRANAYAFIENCYFENAKYPVSFNDDTSSVAKLYGCVVVGEGVYALAESAQLINKTRDATVSNSANANPYLNFDTDSAVFYCDASGNTQVSYLTSAEQAKLDCIDYSGVLK